MERANNEMFLIAIAQHVSSQGVAVRPIRA
jgi:hypothetical protein